MEDWKNYKLGDILNFRRGHDLPKTAMKGGIIPVAGSNGIIGYHNVATPISPCITIGRSGNIGTPYIYDKCWAHNTVLYVDDFKGNNPLYLYYLLKTLPLSSFSGGSAVPTLNRNHIHPLIIKHTSNPHIQQHIASILKSFDDKIEVNKRTNDNLEKQAQALFKSWFVDFVPFKDGEFVESELGMIPKGWGVVSLDEMTSKFGTGLNPRKNFKLGEGDNYYVTIKNMGNNRVYLDDKCDKITDDAIEKINKRSKLQVGDLLFSGIGTIGRVALITEAPKNWNTSESIFNMHPSNGISSEFLYLLLLSDVFQGYIKIHAQGGVQQGIRMLSLKQFRMAIPNGNELKRFDSIIRPIVAKIKTNDKQIDMLSNLRDTLLPRLMSGELKVNDINIQKL